jgi:hypothetical protein
MYAVRRLGTGIRGRPHVRVGAGRLDGHHDQVTGTFQQVGRLVDGTADRALGVGLVPDRQGLGAVRDGDRFLVTGERDAQGVPEQRGLGGERVVQRALTDTGQRRHLLHAGARAPLLREQPGFRLPAGNRRSGTAVK